MSGGIVSDMVERILADLADPQTLTAAKDRAWYAPLWAALEDNGLTQAWVPDTLGGSGLSLAEGFEIVAMAGRFALPVPLVETMMAAWLLAQAGLASPAGAMTVAPGGLRDRIVRDSDGRISGVARNIAFAERAEHVAVLASSASGDIVALVRAADCQIVARTGLSGDPRGDLRFDHVEPVASALAPGGLDQTALMLMGCTVRSLQIARALQATLSMTVDYANERVAFGKSIGRFQAVQNNLARLAGEVAAAETVAGSATDALCTADVWDEAVFLEAVAAKIRCAEAVAAGAAIAHQVHGAIGLTVEHILHRFTLRMQDWRDDFDNESHWAVLLGQRIAAGGAEQLWPLIASR